MGEQAACIICGNKKTVETSSFDGERQYFNCPICGLYVLPITSTISKNGEFCHDFGAVYNAEKLTAYLYHHKTEERYAFVGSEAAFEQYKKKAPRSKAFLVTPEAVENWYPKTFEERIDLILLCWAKSSSFMGEAVCIKAENIAPFFFLKNDLYSDGWNQEVRFIVRYLGNAGLIDYPVPDIQMSTFLGEIRTRREFCLTLSSKAWGLIYDLQKNYSASQTAFVAMKFGDETVELRNMIRKGIEDAGYEAIFMDEIEHNHQIVPEMLNAIKNSKFVVAELSHHNNGAYYEAGYAHGLDKEVIHVCSEDALKNDLHFDVAQICIVKYKKIDELPEKLKKRIEATIF